MLCALIENDVHALNHLTYELSFARYYQVTTSVSPHPAILLSCWVLHFWLIGSYRCFDRFRVLLARGHGVRTVPRAKIADV